MPDIFTFLRFFRRRQWLSGVVVLGIAALGADALAQGYPPGQAPAPQGAPAANPAANPMCARLETQLASIDRGGGGDPAKADQIRRFEDAAARQQGELDRVTSQAKRMGCDSP